MKTSFFHLVLSFYSVRSHRRKRVLWDYSILISGKTNIFFTDMNLGLFEEIKLWNIILIRGWPWCEVGHFVWNCRKIMSWAEEKYWYKWTESEVNVYRNKDDKVNIKTHHWKQTTYFICFANNHWVGSNTFLKGYNKTFIPKRNKGLKWIDRGKDSVCMNALLLFTVENVQNILSV